METQVINRDTAAVRAEYVDTEGKVYSWIFCLRLGSLREIEGDGYALAKDGCVSSHGEAESILRHSIDAGNADDLCRVPGDDLIAAAEVVVAQAFSPAAQKGGN